MEPAVAVFHTVSKGSETAKCLKSFAKSSAVSVFQRFREVVLGVLICANIKTGQHFSEIVKHRNSGRFPSKHQWLVCFTPL
jgi:hypothetical protein